MKVRREVPKNKKDGTRAKKDSVQYQCNVCKEYVSSTKVAVDHIDPVIHPEYGFKDWNEFVGRLFCDAGNLQVICEGCHQEKTNRERWSRTLRQDQERLLALRTEIASTTIPLEVAQKTLKKFTPKKLSKYPILFQAEVMKLRDAVGLKNKKVKNG